MYKRVLLKLSGEALSCSGNSFDVKILASLAKELKEVHDLGVDLAIVVGGGNFIRGKILETMGIDRVQGDYMGMLATVINALAVGEPHGFGHDGRDHGVGPWISVWNITGCFTM